MNLSSALKKLTETQREKEYLEIILNGIKHRIILINREYEILYLNKAAIGEGGDLNVIKGRHCYKKFEKRNSICIDCPATSTFITGDVVHVQRSYQRENGEEITYKISSYPVINRKGQIESAVISSRDITEIYRVEQMKNDLLRMLTHDIRNPVLATAQTLDSLLNCSSQQAKFVTPVQEVLCETRDNCVLLLHMIDDVLDIYRHESNKFKVNKKQLQITSVIKAAVRLVHSLTKDKNIKIKQQLPDDVPPLIADENRLTRVLINLLENAIMYSPDEGKISIAVRIIRQDKTTATEKSPELLSHISISITDQGIGIPKNDLRKVFGKYYQVERKKNEGRIGLGLGLTYCRQVVEVHGGRIWAESPVYRGKGSRFVFTLPLSK